MAKPLLIDYYSDILCVWAWIAQRRIDELNAQLGDKISIRHHYIDLFGDTATRMQTSWADRGLYQGFSQHVLEAAAPFADAQVNADVWSVVRPATSANAHLLIKAVQLIHGESLAIAMALELRRAFFVEARDIADFQQLKACMASLGISAQPVMEVLGNGSAMALLIADYQRQKKLNIKGSPSYVMDNGRQTLYGNVGYRVLLANIEELLHSSVDEASWC